MLKRILFAVLLIAGACFNVIAQSIKYKSVSNQDLTYVLNNLQKRYVYTDHKTLSIAVYLVADQQGDVDAPADCKAPGSIYVAVSEVKPQQYVYKLNPVCDPKFVNWIKSKKMYKIAFSYGPAAKRKTATIGITLKKLVVE
ncbi:hypothetical protein MTO98_28690 [Mucilaginibacter sp. SMC90]|uniref:hypothetical protein n=1 Tax=Mucilaginibacter sp. SMC90 TaxID=2929803 RepID=UPI001FB40E15|nr:hypothetical protein [Mucilaginibacter sp. SMC90]UOE48390.1 hypothetical protein MTO98_28690 [Mucilaginibacter sp. SMC90]